MSVTSDTVRAMFKEGDDIRDAGLTTPEDIIRFDDIAYGEDDPLQVLDVYRPRGREGEVLPVIVSVHGGGWVYGDKERYQYYCMSLAEHGFAVVNFSYRLAPEHKFPTSMVDTCAVFSWVLENAERYGMDADNVFAVGDSAGAHMLSMFSAACTDEDYARALSITPPANFKPCAIALNCGSYRIVIPEVPTGDFMADLVGNLMADLLPEGGTKEDCALISPIDYVSPAWPATFVMTAEDDFLKNDALPLVSTLIEHNVEVSFHYYMSDEHKLAHVFHCDMRLAEAARANADECAFFLSHLR